MQGEKGKRSHVDEDTGKRKAARYSSQNVLSGLLVCAECGANYRRINRSTGAVWRYANRVEHGKRICKCSPSIMEVELKEELCRQLEMTAFDELKVAEMVDTVFIQEDETLKIEYKE